ncbi:MAG: sulfatase-like hydrolase/transferase [Acidimicrobiia bacterium]|nr:sulfatase-like hydrolase/transferase [Acidimicrobiia bacterium]
MKTNGGGLRRPNVCFILTDQERHRGWLPDDVDLPARRRLLEGGMEFNRHYTHTSPCSPSRATLVTGEYMPAHGIKENTRGPANGWLDTGVDTLGKMLRRAGYDTGYKGKWHLSMGPYPDMESYGFGDWEGNDQAFWGQAGSGLEFDEPIAASAAQWIRERAGSRQPWFLFVGLVNPHDVMWFPIDQPWYQEANPEHYGRVRDRYEALGWGRADSLPPFTLDYPERFDELPANFDDDLHTKPDVHRRFVHEMSRNGGYLDRAEVGHWLRQLDYYVKLHELSDVSVGLILDAIDATGAAGDTVVIFTSDHGDQCGSHALRSKGPWNYEETMHIPLYVTVPGLTGAGTRTEALTSHVDLTATVAELAGVDLSEAGLPGRSLVPLLADPAGDGRNEILFAQDWAWYDGLLETRYASRGVFDGRFKYCRYYGIGGSSTTSARPPAGPKLFDIDADFDDQEHELYDLQEDPHELVNLAVDRGRRQEIRAWFDRLLATEAEAFADEPGSRPAGAPPWAEG